jgi:hypothetical protein
LFFAARPFFATCFLLYPRLFSSSINEGCRRKNRRRCLCKCNAADKDSGNGKDGECSKKLEHLQSLIVCELMAQNVRLWPKRTPAGSSATCGSASSHPLTSPFWALVHPQSLYIHSSAHVADVHGGMLFESHCDAIFDVLPARGPPDLFALRLRLARNCLTAIF